MPDTPQKVDLRKSHKHLYAARAKVEQVEAGKATFLAVDGTGEPGGQTFQDSVSKLFALAYTTKFALKQAGKLDFSIPALECLWYEDPSEKPKSEWRWRLMLRIPNEVAAADLAASRKALAAKKGLDTKDVRRITWTEGRAIQVMHIGPYEELGAACCKLREYADQNGLTVAGPVHEVYLSDPRRTAPEKLKTICRMGTR